jgi:beta-glucanase (GH16 family)
VQGTHKQSAIAITDCYTEFHDYILEWDQSELRFYVDKQLYFAYKNDLTGFHTWPFDKRFHLILNVAVGGTYGGAMGIDDRIFPRTMVVDYVRVFQK